MILTLLVTAGALAATPQGPVLPPTAAAQVAGLLHLEVPLEGAQLSAKIERDRVLVSGERGGEVVLAVTLVHPEAAAAKAAALRSEAFALVLEPGPAPEALVSALKARLEARAAAHRLGWVVPEVGGPPARASESATPDAEMQRLHEAFESARHRLAIGEPERAREALAALGEDFPEPGFQLSAALLWQRAGAPDKARGLAEPLREHEDAVTRALARMLLGEGVDAAFVAERACSFVQLARAQRELERGSEAAALLDRVVAADPGCRVGWEELAATRLALGEIDAAGRAVDEGLRRFPESAGLGFAKGSVLHARGEFGAAAQAVEAAIRSRPGPPRDLSVLLSMLVRDVDRRAAHVARLEAAVERDPEDLVSRFLLGVLHHYENRFELSNQLLRPLDGPALADEQRLQIYLAMNDFNLGDAEGALKRLDKAAQAAAPDPDVYYCRAEILRDTRRRAALKDLKRYMSLSDGQVLANPEKQERVAKMLRVLEACVAEGTEVCEGPWEHPRLRHHGGSYAWMYIAGALGVLALALLIRLGRRRRA